MIDSPFGSVRDELITLLRTISEADDVSAGNAPFHNARYRLYTLAAQDIPPETVRALLAEPRITEFAPKIFPICARAGIIEECEIAESLLAEPNLTYRAVFDRYYGSVYKTFADLEWEVLEKAGRRPGSSDRIAFIGSGAVPNSALVVAKEFGNPVVCFDVDRRSCELSRAIIDRVGMSDRVEVRELNAADADYGEFDLVLLANWLEDKERITRRVSDFANLRGVIFRSATRDSLSPLINHLVEPAAVHENGLSILGETAAEPGHSLHSIVSIPG